MNIFLLRTPPRKGAGSSYDKYGTLSKNHKSERNESVFGSSIPSDSDNKSSRKSRSSKSPPRKRLSKKSKKKSSREHSPYKSKYKYRKR